VSRDERAQFGAVIGQQPLQALVIGVVNAAHVTSADEERGASSAKAPGLAIRRSDQPAM
jgi:hypothetical protein